MTKWVDDLKKDYEDKISYAVGFTPPPAAATTTGGHRHPDRVVACLCGEALVELQELTRRLRRDCPWDREQTARTIVPHTVEEAYEVADAAGSGDPAKLLDELGDLLFQVYFLAAAPGGGGRRRPREPWRATSTRSSSGGIRTCSATSRRRRPAAFASAGSR